MTRRAAAAGAAALALAAPGPAGAEPAPAPGPPQTVVGLLDVRGDGVEPVVLDRFAEAVEEGLAGGEGLVPAPRARLLEMLAASSWSPACVVGPCLAEVRSQTAVERVVVGALAGSGQSYRFSLTLLDTARGAVLLQVNESCPACTVDDLASTATLATIALVNGTAEVETPPASETELRADALQDQLAGHARRVRRAAVLLTGLAVVTGAVGAYFVAEDRGSLGYGLAGGAAGLVAAGAVMFGLSTSF